MSSLRTINDVLKPCVQKEDTTPVDVEGEGDVKDTEKKGPHVITTTNKTSPLLHQLGRQPSSLGQSSPSLYIQ